MAPFRVHRATDYTHKNQMSYLSRCRNVMAKIESLILDNEPELQLVHLSLTESRNKFTVGFDLLCAWIFPTLTQIELDVKHLGDAMYLTFYDRINKETKKRKAASLLNA